MALSDQRLTVLEIINEVREKVKLNPVTTVAADRDSILKLKYLNDVLAEVSDYDNWQETLTQVLVTAQSSVQDYEISQQAETQASVEAIQNIHEVVFSDRIADMRKIDLDDLRRLQRTKSYGTPFQWSVKGVDSDGNPKLSVFPMPVSAQNGEVFTLQVYAKPAFVTTAGGGSIPPWPGKLLVQGLLAKTVLDESDGEPTTRYMQVKQTFDDMLDETYNRYNGDTGSTTWFRPGRPRR